MPAECPVCRSDFVALARRIETRPAGAIDLYYCMACESFCSPYAPEHLVGPTLNHHLSVLDRNIEFTQVFLPRIFEHLRPRRIVDVGCGIGTLLHAAHMLFDIAGVGFDLDAEAIAHGVQRFGLDLRAQAWTADSVTSDVDLITCIMVLEHVKWPRPLLNELMSGARRLGCPFFVSVPWLNRNSWPDLRDTTQPSSKFHQPWVHVTHFSETGFSQVCKELGATRLQRVSGHPWPGYLVWATPA
jgi:SAM-dependent methyltransferase